ncbi:TonB-dependent siderophore receptor [Pseudomonas putida]|uniref:Ligand-gated channel n=2 Tax=Pseudomonas TaxID=286 RepID=A0AAU8RW81_PSEPU|nr:TonB-dependent receptor [Pseudomonas putida]AJQ47710.1 ligand-gated channel [Pseudomonas putida S13.1.2]
MSNTRQSHPALALAVHLALGAMYMAGGNAVAASAAQEQTRSYDIAPGSLTETLGQFASAAGVTLSFDGASTEGRRSAGLRGSYSVAGGFATLLAGSNLQAVGQANGIYLLVDGGDGAVVLGATSITGQALGSTTEGTGSYTSSAMQSATKLPLSIRETPQSVTVITRQRMDDQAMRSLDDVVQATPGLRMSAARPANSEYFSRGFPVTNLMFDGLPTTYNADWVAAADMAPYDRVEIVRGATGLMQGAGNPSAAINMVRKRPTQQFQGSITGSAGSWDNYRGELDLSGPLNASASVRGRFVGAYHDKDSYQDYAGRERGLFYGITEFDLTDSTTLTLGASNQNDNNNINWGGLPVNRDGSHVGYSRSTNVGYDWSYQDIDNTTAFAELDHRFDNDWRLHLAASKSWSDFAMQGAVFERTGTPAAEVLRQRVFNQRRDYDQSTYDVYASGPFKLFERQHELVVGASKREVKTSAHGGTVFLPVDDLFSVNPSGVSKPSVADIYTLSEHVEQEGVYATTRINLADPLKLIVGARLDWYDNQSVYSEINDGYYTNADYKVTRNVTRYAGVIYDLDDHHSVYASYTDIFMPQSELARDASIIRPIEGKNYEIGIRGEYFDGALNASVAVFQIDQENRAAETSDQAGCTNFTCYEASGKVRTQGIDLELMGALTPNWQVGAGYTYSQTQYRKDADKTKEGTKFDTDLPEHLFKLSTTYTLPGELHKWRVGGNVYAQSSIFNKGSNAFGNYHIDQGAYAVYGLMVGYKVSEKLDTRLNVNNVFDKKYYQGIASNNTWSPYDVYGDPRNFTVTARYSF